MMKSIKTLLRYLGVNRHCMYALVFFMCSSAHGFVSVVDYGANGSDTVDDTAAFSNAVASGHSVFVPKGTYYVNSTISLQNVMIYGEGALKSVIVGTTSNEMQPLLALGGTCVVENLGLQYDSSIDIYLHPWESRRVLIQTNGGENDWVLQRGSSLRNLKLQHCGTAITDDGQGVFSVTFDTMEIKDFSYKGLYFSSSNRTGNVYRNLYINNLGTDGATEYDRIQSCIIPFHLAGQESECSIDQLNVEWVRCNQGIRLEGCTAYSIGTIHFERVIIKESYNALLDIDESSGTIRSLNSYYCDLTNSCSIIHLRGTEYPGDASNNTCNYLGINTFHSKGINPGDRGFSGAGINSAFKFIYRNAVYPKDYFVEINNVVWRTFRSDGTYYENFSVDPHNVINFINLGI